MIAEVEYYQTYSKLAQLKGYRHIQSENVYNYT